MVTTSISINYHTRQLQTFRSGGFQIAGSWFRWWVLCDTFCAIVAEDTTSFTKDVLKDWYLFLRAKFCQGDSSVEADRVSFWFRKWMRLKYINLNVCVSGGWIVESPPPPTPISGNLWSGKILDVYVEYHSQDSIGDFKGGLELHSSWKLEKHPLDFYSKTSWWTAIGRALHAKPQAREFCLQVGYRLLFALHHSLCTLWDCTNEICNQKAIVSVGNFSLDVHKQIDDNSQDPHCGSMPFTLLLWPCIYVWRQHAFVTIVR